MLLTYNGQTAILALAGIDELADQGAKDIGAEDIERRIKEGDRKTVLVLSNKTSWHQMQSLQF